MAVATAMTTAEAGEAYLAHQERRWKPSTLTASRSYLRTRIAPTALGELPVRDVARRDVARWHAAQKDHMHAADRSLALLSGLMRWAALRSLRSEANPCAGVRRFRPAHRFRARERRLSDEEYSRLWAALPRVRMRFGAHRDARAVVSLLILTGCRQSEIRRMRWREVRDGAVHLEDAKSGPRTVWLCRAARRILDARSPIGEAAGWVFPAPRVDGPMGYDSLSTYWRHVKRRTGLRDLRLHDLRHSYASFAVRRGESLTTVAALLGHRDQKSTLRYAHSADAEAVAAVRKVAEAVGNA